MGAARIDGVEVLPADDTITSIIVGGAIVKANGVGIATGNAGPAIANGMDTGNGDVILLGSTKVIDSLDMGNRDVVHLGGTEGMDSFEIGNEDVVLVGGTEDIGNRNDAFLGGN